MTLAEETPVPISQYDDEFYPLLEIFKKRAPKRILEIGTHYGGTLYHWLTKCPKGSTVVTIDDYQLNINMYDKWAEKKKVDLWPLRADSTSTKAEWAAWRRRPYDWIFIDGGHYLVTVKTDWETYSNMVSLNGVIVFHDITPHPNREVDKLWKEIKKYYDTLEIIGSTPWPEACGIGVVFFD